MAEAFAAGWLEERWGVDAGHLVRCEVEVCPSAGSS